MKKILKKLNILRRRYTWKIARFGYMSAKRKLFWIGDHLCVIVKSREDIENNKQLLINGASVGSVKITKFPKGNQLIVSCEIQDRTALDAVKKTDTIFWKVSGSKIKGRSPLYTLQMKKFSKALLSLKYAPAVLDQAIGHMLPVKALLNYLSGFDKQLVSLPANIDGMIRADAHSDVFIWGWSVGLDGADLIIADGEFKSVHKAELLARTRLDVYTHLKEKGVEVSHPVLGVNASCAPIPDSNRLQVFLKKGDELILLKKSTPQEGDFAGHAKAVVNNLCLDGPPPIAAIELLSRSTRSKVQWRGMVGQDIWLKAPQSEKTPKVSIVVPYYGDSYFLLDQIALQQKMGDGLTHDDIEWIFVCDDVSIFPHMRDFGKSRRPFMEQATRLVLTSHNLGFAGASNLGASLARAPYVLFMNSDIYCTDFDYIAHGIGLMDKDPDIGCTGFTLQYEDGSIQHNGMVFQRNPGLGDLFGLEHPFKGLPAPITSKVSVRECDAVTGALMLVRASDWDQGCVFDTTYVLGDFEDGDLNLTIREKGQKVMLLETSGIYHLERQSIRTMASNYTRLGITMLNCVHFNKKWQTQLQAYKTL